MSTCSSWLKPYMSLLCVFCSPDTPAVPNAVTHGHVSGTFVFWTKKNFLETFKGAEVAADPLGGDSRPPPPECSDQTPQRTPHAPPQMLTLGIREGNHDGSAEYATGRLHEEDSPRHRRKGGRQEERKEEAAATSSGNTQPPHAPASAAATAATNQREPPLASGQRTNPRLACCSSSLQNV